MAPLNQQSAPSLDHTPLDAIAGTDGSPAAADEDGARRFRIRARGRSVPRSPVAYTVGITTVCALALASLVVGEPAASATAAPQEQASVAVADALGIGGANIEQTAREDAQILGLLTASRAQRDGEQAAAAASQAQAEQAAVAAWAEAEARAAAEAAAAAEAPVTAAPAAEAAAPAETAEAAEGTAAAAPAASVPPTTVAKISNSAGPVKPVAQAAANAVVSNVPGADRITIGGTRPSAADPNGHPSGLALDYMVGSDAALGDAITEYHIAHWDQLGVHYIIWQQRILSSPNGSWKQMEDRGSATANHMDHPHVNYRE